MCRLFLPVYSEGVTVSPRSDVTPSVLLTAEDDLTQGTSVHCWGGADKAWRGKCPLHPLHHYSQHTTEHRQPAHRLSRSYHTWTLWEKVIPTRGLCFHVSSHDQRAAGNGIYLLSTYTDNGGRNYLYSVFYGYNEG